MKPIKLYLVIALAMTLPALVVAKPSGLVNENSSTLQNESSEAHAHESAQSADDSFEKFVGDDTAHQHETSLDKHSDSETDGAHGDEGHDEEDARVIELSAESIHAAGIRVSNLISQALVDVVTAPGEVQLNQYSSAEVAPLIDAVVIERHVRLGDVVDVKQTLVTLASVEVAQAQGDLRVAAGDWRRARNLGRSAIGAKRYTQAEVAYEQARLRLSAYGLDKRQIDQVATREFKGTLGQFDLSATVAGTVLRDDFRVGQRINAGQKLFLIADESQIWIKANLSPIQAQSIRVGVPVQVKMGRHWHDGKVIQKHHLLDERTRTVPIRISVTPNGEHHHAGEFVTVSIDLSSPTETDDSARSLVVPESALMQDDAQNWTVFVQEKPGHFRQQVVRRGITRGALVAISGLPEGIAVVTEGAFFLASELAKSGFDIHDH